MITPTVICPSRPTTLLIILHDSPRDTWRLSEGAVSSTATLIDRSSDAKPSPGPPVGLELGARTGGCRQHSDPAEHGRVTQPAGKAPGAVLGRRGRSGRDLEGERGESLSTRPRLWVRETAEPT